MVVCVMCGSVWCVAQCVHGSLWYVVVCDVSFVVVSSSVW